MLDASRRYLSFDSYIELFIDQRTFVHWISNVLYIQSNKSCWNPTDFHEVGRRNNIMNVIKNCQYQIPHKVQET